jgi:hypothetical protein
MIRCTLSIADIGTVIPAWCGSYRDESMSEHKSPITDFVATDDSGGFFNLRTGEVLSVDEMLCLYTRSALESVPIGYRRQRSAFRRQSQPPAQSAALPETRCW